MGWHDDGVKLGLWGADGVPYHCKGSSRSYSSRRSSSKSPRFSLVKSAELARKHGFSAVECKNAFGGSYFIKNGKKWIHDLGALKRSLGVTSDDELEDLGYDVTAYFRYR